MVVSFTASEPPFCAIQPFRDILEYSPLSPDQDHLKALVVGHVRVEGCLNAAGVLVLDLGERLEQPPLVVVVDHGDDALALPFDVGYPLVMGDVTPY
jgi:hypothetical protein